MKYGGEFDWVLGIPEGMSLSSEHPAAIDPEHWSVGPVLITRDSGVLEQVNRDALIAHLEEVHPDDWELLQARHWGCGWVEHLSFKAVDDEGQASTILEVLQKWFDGLADYPCADDAALSQAEYDVAIENISNNGRRFLANDVDTDDWEKRVWTWLWENDQRALEDVDGQGPYPSDESLRRAMRTLELTEDCPHESCVEKRGHEGLHMNEEGWAIE